MEYNIIKKFLSITIEYPVSNEELKERLQWLIKLRWTGCIGVLVATHAIREIENLTFALIPVYLILGFVALYNCYFLRRLKVYDNLKTDALHQIILDYIAITAAIYFSGGCNSPFLYYFVFHIVISGIILPRVWTFRFAASAIALITAIAGFQHLGILPHYSIFRDEPIFFESISVMLSYGAVLASTFFLTAYFVTYLSDKLYKKQEEIRRLYTLSEKLRSSIVMDKVIKTIQEELSLLTGISNIQYLSVDKNKVALVHKDYETLSIPLSNKNAFTDTLLTCDAHILSSAVVKSVYEDAVFKNLMNNAKEIAIFPVQTSFKDKCFDFFHCPEGSVCPAYKADDRRCWHISDTYCQGEIFRTPVEKLKQCVECDLFTPVGIFILDITPGPAFGSTHDLDGCARLLDSAILAVSNAKLYEKTLELSETDGLTGLKNRRSFLKLLASEISRANRYSKPFGLMMLDIDLFKQYNDTNGHPQGDVLLKMIAGSITNTMRETDIVARYGGEEFITLLPESTKEETIAIAERIRSSIEDYSFPRAEKQPGGKITISIGVSSYPGDGDSTEKIIRAADDALYTAKELGRNMVIVANKPDGLL